MEAGQVAYVDARHRGVNTDGKCFTLVDYWKLYFTPEGEIVSPLPDADALGCTEPEKFFWLDGVYLMSTAFEILAQQEGFAADCGLDNEGVRLVNLVKTLA